MGMGCALEAEGLQHGDGVGARRIGHGRLAQLPAIDPRQELAQALNRLQHRPWRIVTHMRINKNLYSKGNAFPSHILLNITNTKKNMHERQDCQLLGISDEHPYLPSA